MFQSIKNLKDSKSSLQKVADKNIENLNIEINELTQKLDQIKTCKADTVEQFKTLCDDRISSLIGCEGLDKQCPESAFEFRRSPLISDPPKNAQNLVFP